MARLPQENQETTHKPEQNPGYLSRSAFRSASLRLTTTTTTTDHQLRAGPFPTGLVVFCDGALHSPPLFVCNTSTHRRWCFASPCLATKTHHRETPAPPRHRALCDGRPVSGAGGCLRVLAERACQSGTAWADLRLVSFIRLVVRVERQKCDLKKKVNHEPWHRGEASPGTSWPSRGRPRQRRQHQRRPARTPVARRPLRRGG